MTAEEIKQYKENIGKKIKKEKYNESDSSEEYDTQVHLHGYTSTSLKKSIALTFAWEEPKTGHQKVLIHFKWNNDTEAYYLDAGAFDHEKEVLLYDGVQLIVESVEEIKNDK